DEEGRSVHWHARPAVLSPDATLHTTWRVPPMRTVHGRVVDEAERGLPGVRVGLAAGNPLMAAGRMPVPAPGPGEPAGDEFTATTDGDGKFRIDSVPEGRYLLRISSDELVGALPLHVEVDAKSEERQHRVIA